MIAPPWAHPWVLLTTCAAILLVIVISGGLTRSWIRARRVMEKTEREKDKPG